MINFHPLEVVDRGREAQLQVEKKHFNILEPMQSIGYS